MKRTSSLLALVLLGSVLSAAGCSRTAERHAQSSASRTPAPPVQALAQPPAGPAPDQATFGTPEEGVNALVAALEKRDRAQLGHLLGPHTDQMLSSGDAVSDSVARAEFIRRYRVKHHLVAGGPDDIVLQVGQDDWPLPIPVVRRNGRWYLDGAAGAQEIVMRRIGRNELSTIAVMRGVVVAQRDYASASHDGAAAGAFAQTFRSQTGKHNGLYWEPGPGESPSPAGPFLARAESEGYSPAGSGDAYHGYRYRMLASQGPAASGGARDYVVDGRSTGGFALIAWPVQYGASGVMTFLVNQDGVVWQRDLGPNTEQVAGSIQRFDPDRSWTPLPTEQ
jgi:hypothetical protein